MKILVVNADCLMRNSSANLCHLAYIRGLVDAGHEVSVLSADGRDYMLDETMQIPENVHSFTIYGVSLYEKLSMRKSRNLVKKSIETDNGKSNLTSGSLNLKIKEIVRSLYGPHGIYLTFVHKACGFKLKEQFDVLISISTPPASHLLAYKLLKRKNIRATHWIQIWEDPWYCDVYGFNGSKRIFKEERKILSYGEKICYVSPLTLKNQKKIYPESADKMYWQPLPAYYDGGEQLYKSYKNKYGYFGDYVPEARDLKPFYVAAKQEKIIVNICGNPSNLFDSTDRIYIHPRLSLSELKPIEDDTNILVFLCNRKGGQIPGKIYQYSATTKTILFILDGTEEEKRVLKDYFSKFNRYIFCENTVADITRAINEIESGCIGGVINRPLDCFTPEKVIEGILNGVEEKI